MDCTPSSVEDVLYTWAVFAGVATFSLGAAELLVLKHATEVGGGAIRRIPLARLRALNVMLVAYLLVVFYATLLFACLSLHAGMSLLHLSADSIFGFDHAWMHFRSVRIGMRVMDNLLDPGLAFGFMAPRMWKMHLGVIIAVLVATVVHTILFVSPARIRALGGWKEDEDGDAGRPQTQGRGESTTTTSGVGETGLRRDGRDGMYQTIFPVAWYGRFIDPSSPTPDGTDGRPLPFVRTPTRQDPYLVQRLFSDTSSTVIAVLGLLYVLIMVREVIVIIASKALTAKAGL